MRNIFNFLTKLVLIVTAIGAAVFCWAYFVEPTMIRVEEVTVEARALPSAAQGLKIVQFSDTHLGFGFDEQMLADAVEQINMQLPDIIAFTGDLYDDYSKSNVDDAKVIELLGKLSAPLGKYAVLGNHDYGPQAQDRIDEILTMAGFTVLYNDTLQLPEYGLTIFGMDDAMFGKGNALAFMAQPGSYNLVLCHEPDVFAQMDGVDLMLSGHTHGGQIRLPLLGAVALPRMGREYVAGLYEDGAERLYVNRGLGTTIMKLRFLCTPEITVLTLSRPE